MSYDRRQTVIFTMRPKSRRMKRSLVHRSELPIKVKRGIIDAVKEPLSKPERLAIRSRLRNRNKRILLTSAAITLILLSFIAIFTTQYLNDIAQKM